MNALYADLRVESVSSPVPPPARVQPAVTRGWDTRMGEGGPLETPRPHTPLSAAADGKAATARATGRITYSAGWSTKKSITFDAAL